MRPRRNLSGFTLIELMVVITILAIISSIGYPMYTDQVRKARRTDARGALQQIAMAQERFYTLNGRYTTDLGSLNLPVAIRSGSSEEGYYDISVSMVNNILDTYVATAQATAGKAQAGDEDCTSLIIDYTGVQSATGEHTDNCW